MKSDRFFFKAAPKRFPYAVICLAAMACAGVTVAQTSASSEQLKSLDAWFDALKAAPAPAVPPTTAVQAAEQPRSAVEGWFNNLGSRPPAPSVSGRVIDSTDSQLQGTQLAANTQGPLQLKLEHRFESIKYVVFFTPGSAQLGPIGRKTVGLLLPKAREAAQVSVTARSDPTGVPELNDALSRRRGEAIVSALRKGGAVRPIYDIRIDSRGETPPDAQALWRPSNQLGSLRRAMIDVQSERPAQP